MKNILLLFAILTLSVFGLQAQNGAYEKGMGKAFELWTQNKTTEASALFERIAVAEKDNWMPYYYAANVLISSSFSTTDKVKRNEMLKKSKELLKEAHDASPDNSEIVTLEGLLYTAYVAMEPETYAMQYSAKVAGLHERAIKLNPKNPRAQLNKVEWEIGTARFFGQELNTFCGAIDKAKPLFENQDDSVPFAPSYGAERITSLKNECGCE